MWVAAQVMIGQDEMIHRIAVVAAESFAPIVEAGAVLGLPSLDFDFAGLGPDAEIAAGDIDFLTGFHRTNDAAAVAIGAVNPIIQAVGQSIQAMLLIAFAEAVVED